jgi:hypothetical protein
MCTCPRVCREEVCLDGRQLHALHTLHTPPCTLAVIGVACPGPVRGQVEVPAEVAGKFYSGDSYVVHYTYNSGSGLAHIVYFWLGKGSSPIEQGSAAARTKELCDSLVRRPGVLDAGAGVWCLSHVCVFAYARAPRVRLRVWRVRGGWCAALLTRRAV